MNDLVITGGVEKHLTLYRSMVSAIDACHRIDQCKDIIDKSVAFAAYYKQIEDDETVQRFYEVRLRAWRRIGKLFATVDTSGCANVSQTAKAIRAAFDPQVMRGISDSRIVEIIKLSALTDGDFEYAIAQDLSTGSIGELMRMTPAFEAECERNRKAVERARIELEAERKRGPTKAEIEATERTERAMRHSRELLAASDDAMKEIGITLERKDRARMKQVVFLIKDEVHSVMRKAAFDQKITMQEVLRRGLKMWLVAHDYKFPE